MPVTDSDGKTSKKKSGGLLSAFKRGDDEETQLSSRFEVGVDDLRKKFSDTVVSRMQILNLASLIVRRDVDQAEMIKKAEVIALGVIEDNFRDGDAFVHPDVGVYGFLFPKVSLHSAQLRRQVIAGQIARLVNDADPQILNLEFEAKTRKRRSGTFAAVVGQKKNAAAASSGAPDPKKLQELEKKKAQANLAIQAMTVQPRDQAKGPLVKEVSWWAGDEPPRPGERGLPAGMATVFRAMWNVGNKVLTAYSALPVIRSPDGNVESIVRVGDDSDMYGVAAACDRVVQEEALNKLHLLLDAGHKVLLVLPVHFSTVNHHDYFVAYQQRLRRVNPKLQKLVVQELVGIPRDINQHRIRETVTRLRQAARSVMARLPVSAGALPAWREAGVHAVGFEFADDQVPERMLLKGLDRFAERAEEAGLKKFVYGLDTRSAASAAVAAGFDYIEGNIVRPPVDSPKYIEPFESVDLFAGLFRR